MINVRSERQIAANRHETVTENEHDGRGDGRFDAIGARFQRDEHRHRVDVGLETNGTLLTLTLRRKNELGNKNRSLG